MLPNFRLSNDKPLSERFRNKGMDTFHDAIRYVQKLPYGRNSSTRKASIILTEGKGTCSTKHACLKTLAEENEINSIDFNLAIYSMNGENTPGVGQVLKKYNLDYILEAHTYLSYDSERFDYTFQKANNRAWEKDILIEIPIDADQVGSWKKEYHQSVLKSWIKREKMPYSLDEIWDIREECIKALSPREV
ncbi:hypothetical protein EAX61_07950 [Dokdonia sinensis]|uniref:Uncharacterized protein n=2 Tax=Dokdonia sinensis TaxID=2479847 RepID=A0A3M0G4L2_9FLAO|nr:hypothetical protein EAX61_07950 [Dokdonia sinensis]